MMKFKSKSALSILLAAAMVVGLAACADSGKQETDATDNKQETTVPLDNNGHVGFVNGDITLNIPSGVVELVHVETLQDDPDGTLFNVSEKASMEAGEADGHDASWGDGWLFGIRRVNADTLHEMLCGDMSGANVFAKDADGNYYLYTHPTDVRLYRSDDSYEQAMEQWSALNKWAWDDVRADVLAENSALAPFERGNSLMDIYLARAAYQDDTNCSIITFTSDPLASDNATAAPYAERLMGYTACEAADIDEAPAGEFIVLDFPDDEMRLDFFFAEGKENYVRQLYNNTESLVKLTYADGTKASEVVREWFDELAAAADMAQLGYTPDDLVGRWAEKMAGRALITVEKTADDSYAVTIDWPDSAAEHYVWEMTAAADGDGGALRYENGRHYVRTFTSDTEYTDETQYEDGTGRLFLNSAFEIMWEDDVADAGANCVFVNVD